MPEYEIRHNHDGTLDEVWARGAHVHVEQMSDELWWMGLTFPDGSMLHVNFWTPRTRIRASWWYEDECGDFAQGGETGARGVVTEGHR